MDLPQDIARCNGQVDGRDRTAEPCIECERRTAPRSERQPMTNGRMEPSLTFCQDRIPGRTVFVPGWLVSGKP
jgi:hypothetical protein